MKEFEICIQTDGDNVKIIKDKRLNNLETRAVLLQALYELNEK